MRKPYCLTDLPSEPQLPLSICKFYNQCLLTLALRNCGRRGSVIQAQRQIHRALRAAFTMAVIRVCNIAGQVRSPSLAPTPGFAVMLPNTHSVRGIAGCSNPTACPNCSPRLSHEPAHISSGYHRPVGAPFDLPQTRTLQQYRSLRKPERQSALKSALFSTALGHPDRLCLSTPSPAWSAPVRSVSAMLRCVRPLTWPT
jgi:hypothetical protein